MSEDDCPLINITTVQASAFKTLIEALKDILVDCNLEFIPDSDGKKDGSLKILAVNNQAGMLVHLRLQSQKFDHYFCAEKQTIGLNMQLFHKVIKTVNSNDILTIYRSSNDYEKNRVVVKLQNKEKKQINQYNIQIIDVDSDVLDVSQASFQAIVVMNSSDFQKICKDLNGIEVRYVDVTLVGSVLKISGKGESVNGSAEYHENQNVTISRSATEDSNVIITGKYELKNLLQITKCTNLCNQIEIYLKNDYPLLIKYTIASLGYMHLCLSPIIAEV